MASGDEKVASAHCHIKLQLILTAITAAVALSWALVVHAQLSLVVTSAITGIFLTIVHCARFPYIWNDFETTHSWLPLLSNSRLFLHFAAPHIVCHVLVTAICMLLEWQFGFSEFWVYDTVLAVVAFVETPLYLAFVVHRSLDNPFT